MPRNAISPSAPTAPLQVLKKSSCWFLQPLIVLLCRENMEQLLLVVLPLVFVFFLPSASPQAENLGGDGVEGRFLQFTIEEGGQLGGGYEAKSEGKQDMGLFVGSDVIRGKMILFKL